MEKVIETYKIENAIFELVEKPETIYAGKFFYAKNYVDLQTMFDAVRKIELNWQTLNPYKAVIKPKLPITDVGISINFWLDEKTHGYGFGRETITENQPVGADVLKMPASLFIKACINEHTAMLFSKEEDDIIDDLFSYIRNNVMPMHGFKEAENGAQEMEIYDSVGELKARYLYTPVKRA